MLIAGDIRVGKSTLAYGLMEAMHERSLSRPTHVFGFPVAKAHLLPDWITPVEDPEFPDDSIVIADEAYRRFYSRESMSDANKLADQFAGLVGQKGILAIYVTQTARKLEIALVSGAQVFLLKKPSRLMVLLDRSALRPLLSRAFESFEASSCPPAEATYVVSDPFEGFLEHSNTPPSFWSEDLSRVWRGVALSYTEGVVDGSRVLRADWQMLTQHFAECLINYDQQGKDTEVDMLRRAFTVLDQMDKGLPLSLEMKEALVSCKPLVGQHAAKVVDSLPLDFCFATSI